MFKSFFLFAVLIFTSSLMADTKPVDEMQFSDLTIASMQTLRAEKKITYEQLVRYYLKRIDKYDPTLKSVIALAPDALAIAKQKDVVFEQGNATGMLYGVPVLIKDNIDVKGLPTTAGALALAGNIATQDAAVVAKLRKEGAIILGKTNLSEWANFKTMKSSSGYSVIGGQTRNPYNINYTACGSSSGSAVALAADFSLVAIGTETDGSILCPSSMNGIVGFKPTNYKISQRGIVPLAKSQDTAGPMARNVTDAALVYSAITDDISPSVAHNLDYNALSVGLIGSMQEFYSEHLNALTKVLDLFAVKGTKINNHLPFEQLDALFNAEFQILMYEFQRDITPYLAQLSQAKVKSLEELIKFNAAQGDTNQSILESSFAFKDTEKYNLAKLIIQEFALQQLKKLKEKHNIDVFIAPTTGKPWKIDQENGDAYSGSSTWLAAMIGAPAITVPLQMINGMPSGITFFGMPGDDAKVLSVATEFEKMVAARVPPKF